MVAVWLISLLFKQVLGIIKYKSVMDKMVDSPIIYFIPDYNPSQLWLFLPPGQWLVQQCPMLEIFWEKKKYFLLRGHHRNKCSSSSGNDECNCYCYSTCSYLETKVYLKTWQMKRAWTQCILILYKLYRVITKIQKPLFPHVLYCLHLVSLVIYM